MDKKEKMKLNTKKTKSIIFNFTKKFQFSTKLSVDNENLEIVREAKLLGTHITDDLKWNKNTSEIVKNAYKRMQLLIKASKFTKSKSYLESIYLTDVRSILGQSAVVWHSSLSMKNRMDLERVQKAAVRIMLGENYTSYKNGLKILNLKTLNDRRKELCLKFAKKSLGNNKVKDMFPIKKSLHPMKKRKQEAFKHRRMKTERYKKSSIPYMINLLNKDVEEKKRYLDS